MMRGIKGNFVLALACAIVAVTPVARGQSVGDSVKKIFSTPTPTPHRKKKSTKPTPSPSPKKTGKTEESPTPSTTPPEEVAAEKSPSPTPAKKAKKKSSPSPSPSASKKKKKGATPTPTETPSPTATPSPTPEETPSAEKNTKGSGVTASLNPDAIRGFSDYSPKVQKLLSGALELTTRNLNYKYGSADPSSGGMDCSGFVYYLLRENGIADVPRDSAAQYVWLRKANAVEPVVSRKEDTFELENLKPGDLLFWTGTYSIERDPPITHAMIYLGREKKTGKRIMVGASDGRTYDGVQRYGVSVFDFKLPRLEKDDGTDRRTHPNFIGYGHIPELRQE